MAAKTLMIQGTASHVGKSVVTAALCRLFSRRGLRVAPFKAQNMSNNSFVTPEGHEIGRAQAVQAQACGIPPHVDFNPVLIKPSGERSAQVIVEGRVAGQVGASDFLSVRDRYQGIVHAAFDRLAKRYDLIILEGAGSPAEINLREQDMVNMAMARHASAPVLLVGDIDRGGVFASLVGTLELLPPSERRHVKGYLINKFRGASELLSPGLQMLTDRTGVPCLGVLPHWNDLSLPEEDSLGWPSATRARCDRQEGLQPTTDRLRVGIVELPLMSNFTDFDALAAEPDLELLPVRDSVDQDLDLLLLPGTKNTAAGLRFVHEHGIGSVARQVLERNGMILGLCGGYQMLGHSLVDPHGVESNAPRLQGLGLLDATTVLERSKVTAHVSGHDRVWGCSIQGYEVHMGRTEADQTEPFLDIRTTGRTDWRPDGSVRSDGRVIGTYVHGLFDAPGFRRRVLNHLRAGKGWPALPCERGASTEDRLDGWADFVQRHVDVDPIHAMIERGMQ